MKNPHYTKKGPGRRHDSVTLHEKVEYLSQTSRSHLVAAAIFSHPTRRLQQQALIAAARGGRA